MLPDADDARIVDYLLGELPDEDRTRLEERFLRDVEYRDLIRAVEDDLIDDYVRDELAPRQRELFEKHFTSLPHRRQKVELARALSRRLSERPRARESAAWSFLRAPTWAFRYALPAAAALLLVVGVWFTTRPSPPTESARSQAEQEPPSGRPAPPGEPRVSEPSPPAQTSPLQPAIATFVLPPGLTRETGQSTAFVVPPGTERVRLQLAIEPGDDYPAYRAQLRTASGDPSWQSGTVRPETGPAGQSLTLELSADILRSQKYELTLAGLDREKTEDVGYYYFTVVKK